MKRYILLALVIVIVGMLGGLYYSKLKEKKPTYTIQEQKPAEDTSGKVTLLMWMWETPVTDFINDFEEKNPGIKIRLETFPHDKMEREIDLAITSGSQLPDIIAAEGTIIQQYIKRGALLDITDKAKKYENEFVGYKWEEVKSKDRIYALPWDSGPVAMFYKRSIFEKEKIDPTKINTWNDFINAGKKIAKDTDGDGKKDQFMINLSTENNVVGFFEMILQQDGGSLFDANGNLTVNNEKGIKALKLMQRMVNEGITSSIGYWTPEFYNELRKNTTATYVQAAWLYLFLKKIAPNTSGDWGVTAMPAWYQGGIRSSNNGGSNLGVSATSTHKEEAFQFIEYSLTRSESQLKTAQNDGLFPALKSVYKDPEFLKPDQFFGNQAINKVFIDTQEKLSPNWHYGPYFRESARILDVEIAKALRGEQTAEAALKTASEKIQPILK